MEETVLRLEGFAEVSEVLSAGVYALCRKGVVLYVGKSKKPLARINAHRRKWIDKRKRVPLADQYFSGPALLFDQVFIRPCKIEDLDKLETEMINLYKPRYNTQLKKPGRVTQEVTLTVRGIPLVFNKKPEPFVRRI